MRIVVEGAQADTGQTPKATVWTKNKARLYRYEPEKEKKYPVPILIVYALINRPYVLDLIPGNSFIEYLVGEGFDVYLLDWGIPGEEDRDMRSEEHTSELQSRQYLVCRLLLEKKKKHRHLHYTDLSVFH